MQLLEELVSELQLTDPVSSGVTHMDNPPYYRITSSYKIPSVTSGETLTSNCFLTYQDRDIHFTVGQHPGMHSRLDAKQNEYFRAGLGATGGSTLLKKQCPFVGLLLKVRNFAILPVELFHPLYWNSWD